MKTFSAAHISAGEMCDARFLTCMQDTDCQELPRTAPRQPARRHARVGGRAAGLHRPFIEQHRPDTSGAMSGTRAPSSADPDEASRDARLVPLGL